MKKLILIALCFVSVFSFAEETEVFIDDIVLTQYGNEFPYEPFQDGTLFYHIDENLIYYITNMKNTFGLYAGRPVTCLTSKNATISNEFVKICNDLSYPNEERVREIIDEVINQMIDEGGIIRDGVNYKLMIEEVPEPETEP